MERTITTMTSTYPEEAERLLPTDLIRALNCDEDHWEAAAIQTIALLENTERELIETVEDYSDSLWGLCEFCEVFKITPPLSPGNPRQAIPEVIQGINRCRARIEELTAENSALKPDRRSALDSLLLDLAIEYPGIPLERIAKIRMFYRGDGWQ
jgi:hypothetical protein